jgi:3-deoxy-D-manno-octulosonic-acid transferase
MPERTTFALRGYRFAMRALTPLAPQVMARRLARGKEHPKRNTERYGYAGVERPQGQLVWIHGASVGEVLAASALIERLRDLGFTVLLTSGTVTSAEIAARRFGNDVIHQFMPYDFPRFAERFLDTWKPSLALFVESDIWPNMIMAASRRRIPMMIVNGRLSQRSYERWRHARHSIAALLGRFDLCLAQTQADADRFNELGAPRVVMAGNLKLDVPAPPVDQAKLDRFSALTRGRPLFVAASTHPGEEDILIEMHRNLRHRVFGLMTVIVPRHPQRGEAIARAVAAAGLKVAVRSHDQTPSSQIDVYVADTIGELGLFYRAVPIVFMGGSLVEHGGQNPIEAVKLGAVVAHGPHVFNFSDIYEALDQAGGARRVLDGESLGRQVSAWLMDAPQRLHAAQAARQVVAEQGGALDRTLSVLEPYLMQLRLEGGAYHA